MEKSLSIDNLFVFVIIVSAFAVPEEHQSRALTIGIVLALLLRGIFIALGAALLDAFSFMFLIFGLALLGTAVQLFRHRNQDPSVQDNALVGAARRALPITDRYDGGRIFTRIGERRALTPMFLVLFAIGTTDLLFALDSIPAVFGVTQHAYIVFWKAPDNRHEEGNERVLHRRPSKSRWPRPCVGDPRGRSEALDRGARRPDIEPRNDVCPGCRRGQKRRKATPPVALSRVVGGPRGVGEPVHACDLFMLRTGRSRGRPLPVDDAPSWMVRGVACRRAAGREGNAKAVILR